MPCFHPIKLPQLEHKVPCGRCIGCGVERSRQWALRCDHEANTHEDNCALTLTYRDENLPFNTVMDYDTGEFIESGMPSLLPKDLEKFWKRLRKKYGKGKDGTGIKYFACGEYGAKGKRPHYHACVFNHDFADKYRWKKAKKGWLYRSPSLEKLWPHGDALIGDMSFEAAAYVARYILDKWFVTGKKFCDDNGLEREFVRMSRNPGIGFNHYINNFNDMFPNDIVIKDGKELKPPRYYMKMLQQSNPITYESLKQLRKENRPQLEEQLQRRLDVKERILKSKLKSLNRPL